VPLPTVPLAHPTLIPRPVHHEGWVYEEKVDGWRVAAYKDASGVRLITRQGNDLTRRFPEVAAAINALRFRRLILDGEVAVYDNQLISRFEWLRERPTDEIATPPMFMAFDLLHLDETDLRPEPLRVRRGALEYVLDGAPAVLLPVRRLADDGLKAWQQMLEHGYEGLVAKTRSHPNVGGRTLKWLKVKQAKYREGERGWEAKA
jgi:bifunctional non-homologous end joining protein LigD